MPFRRLRNMPINALLNQHTHLATLAQGWLASGASAFGVWSNGAPLAYWPNRDILEHPSLCVAIYCGQKILGDLRVSGLYDIQSQERLAAEANLVSHLIRLEEEMNTLVADLVDSQDRLLAVYQLTRSLRYYTTLEDTLRGLLFEAMRLVKTRAGFVMYAPENQGSIIIQYPENFGNTIGINQIFAQVKTRAKEISLTRDDFLGLYSDAADNLIFIPIRIRGAFIAGLGLINKDAGFSSPDIKLAQAIIEQAGTHIEQVLLQQETLEQDKVQRELDLARKVQLRLLPQHIPSIPGLDIAAHSRPARQIGGDFYDFISIPNRPFMVAVGDVSGKALSAALLMTMARTAIHSKASYMPNPEPELVMRNSNEDLFEDFLQVGMFATTFIGQYQPKSRTLVYANAGHSPIIYCSAGETPKLLGADSPPLGVLRTSMCKNHIVPLRPGDLLIIGTDGLNEARGPEEELFGYERLLNLISASVDMPACSILETIYTAIEAFSTGRPQDDDQTLVVIKGV